jgi:hypothetical protein
VTPRIYRRRALIWTIICLALFASAFFARQWAWTEKEVGGIEFKVAFALLAVFVILAILAMAAATLFALMARPQRKH